MSTRTCPDWPRLMEVAPELQFRHHTLGEVQLPHEAFVRIEGIGIDEVVVCCDVDALRGTHWIDVRELGAPPAAA